MSQVAQAAQQLGLQTASPDALRIDTDEYLTSVFAGHQAHQASSLDEALEIVSKNHLSYPLIIKPCNGWSSEGVFRVDSLDTLTAAVKSIDTSRHGSESIIEKYCAGLEINPRPLGMTGSQAIAVADKSRACSLSQPFKHGAQYTCAIVFIPADYPSSCQGIFDSEDICTELRAGPCETH
jgi:D-alanine-D-alanine ligase-like ATP-grasp enzyme